MSGAAAPRYPVLWSVETGFIADAVLLFQLVIGAGGDGVGVALLVVADAAPVELGQVVAERAEKVMLAGVGKIGGIVSARGGLLHFVAVDIFAGLVGLHGGGLFCL